jgi:hypothetical protein
VQSYNILSEDKIYIYNMQIGQCWVADSGPVCLGCLWLAVPLCRESCCAEKAAVLSFTVWLFGWLFGCKLGIVLNNLNVTRR